MTDLTAADWAAMRAKVGEVIATAISRCDVAGCDYSQPDRVCSSCLNLEQLERDHLALLDALARQQEATTRIWELVTTRDAMLADRDATIARLTAANDTMRHLYDGVLSDALRERDRRVTAEVALADRDATNARLTAMLAACAPYLKDDETPVERIERDGKDADALMTVLGQRTKELHNARSNVRVALQEIADRDATIARLTTEHDELRAAVLPEAQRQPDVPWSHEGIVLLAQAHREDSETMDSTDPRTDTYGDASDPDKARLLRAERERAKDATIARLREALDELRINANRLCDRQLGGTYEDDCRRSLAKADALLTPAKEADRG
jgi:hypothetical protein